MRIVDIAAIDLFQLFDEAIHFITAFKAHKRKCKNLHFAFKARHFVMHILRFAIAFDLSIDQCHIKRARVGNL
ncbi:hypothetical protein D3C81_2100400 [compost metagenome]